MFCMLRTMSNNQSNESITIKHVYYKMLTENKRPFCKCGFVLCCAHFYQ